MNNNKLNTIQKLASEYIKESELESTVIKSKGDPICLNGFLMDFYKETEKLRKESKKKKKKSKKGTVKVVSLYKQCTSLTIGNRYKVVKKFRKYDIDTFTIINDNGVKRSYQFGNSMFSHDLTRVKTD